MSLKKLLCLIGSLTLTVPLVTSVVACGGGQTKAQPVSLRTVITESESNLGNVYIGQVVPNQPNQPTENQIKNELNKKYPNLQLDKINIQNITSVSAKITSADLNVYTDEEVDITFKTDNFTEVNGVVGAVWSMATDEAGKIYVGTADGIGTGHLYQSTDGGKTFIPIGSIKNSVSCIFIDKNKIYVGTSSGKYDAGAGQLHLSIDGGENFTVIDEQLIKNAVWSMIIDDAGKLYVGTYMGSGKGGKLYRSKNSTSTAFEDITKLGITIVGAVWCMAIDNVGKIYVGTGAGGGKGHLYRSTNADVTAFEDITTKIETEAGITEAVWCMAIDNAGKLYVGTYTKNSVGHLYQSNDVIGTSFTQLSAINNAVASLTIDLNGDFYVGLQTKDSTGIKTIGKILKQTNDVFVEVSGVTDTVWSMVTDKAGNIYAGTDVNIQHMSGHLYQSGKL